MRNDLRCHGLATRLDMGSQLTFSAQYSTQAQRLERLRSSLAHAWGRETSAAPHDWTDTNPALGQCAVTALIVHDEFGGELLRAMVGGMSHYWNRLPSGEEVDLTRQQFSSEVVMPAGQVRPREYLLENADTLGRYHRLRTAVDAMCADHA
jgi:hypothetical protein